MMKKTDRELYRASFDRLHLSEGFEARLSHELEAEKERKDSKMNNIRTLGLGRVAAIAAAFTLAFGSACFAADLGGIRTNIRLWINGINRNIEVTEMENGTLSWTDESGENHGFGGYSMTEGGKVTAMPSKDMISYMNNSAELEFKDDKVIFHYHNLSEDVTDKISPDGVLHVHVDDPANPNTYFDFEGIGKGTFSTSCSAEAAKDVTYHEADTTGLVSDDPVNELDDDTEISFTTQVTE